MRKILLIFVFSCSQLSWGLDALDGRQIVCKASPQPVFPKTGIRGFRFDGRQVKGDLIIVDNDTVIIKHYRTGPVKRIGLRKVEFWETNGASWELDRTSLVLESALNSRVRTSILLGNHSQFHYWRSDQIPPSLVTAKSTFK